MFVFLAREARVCFEDSGCGSSVVVAGSFSDFVFFALVFLAGFGGSAGSSGSSGILAFAVGPRFLGSLPDEESDVFGVAIAEVSVLSGWVAVAALAAFVSVWAFLPFPPFAGAV